MFLMFSNCICQCNFINLKGKLFCNVRYNFWSGRVRAKTSTQKILLNDFKRAATHETSKEHERPKGVLPGRMG